MIFFDTNVLVAASMHSHEHHARSLSRLNQIAAVGGGVCAAHSLAEAFSICTRVPLPYRFTPEEALAVVEQTSRTFRLVALTAVELVATIADLARRNLAGGMIYDAPLLACARKMDAETIYTFDTKHFKQIAPDLAERITRP